MGTGQSKISAYTYRMFGAMFEGESKNSPAVNTGFKNAKWTINQYKHGWILSISPQTEVQMKTHPIVINGWFSHLSFMSVLLSCCDASGEQHRHSAEWDCHYKYLSLLLRRTYLPSGERASTTALPFSKLAIQNKTHSKWLWWFSGRCWGSIYCTQHCCLWASRSQVGVLWEYADLKSISFQFFSWAQFCNCSYYPHKAVQ